MRLVPLLLISIAAWPAMREAPAERLPGDPLFKNQRSFQDLNITRAWELTTGSRGVVVAVLDDGFFYHHEDVRENIWRNSGESGPDAESRPKETNGIDDDHNGYVDDVMGWDFAFNDPDPDCYVFDGMDRNRIQPIGHATHALGIPGAGGNNGIGIAGINWDVSLMLLKIGAQGIGRNETDIEQKHRAAKAIRFAVDNGARIINWSGFVEDTDLTALKPLQEAFDYAEERGVLIVLAAGNSGMDLDAPRCPVFPQCFQNGNSMLVAQVDLQGQLVRSAGRHRTSASNFGRTRVHIAAIGENYTTHVQHGLSAYRVTGGTSNSAPVVSGVAALILSLRPDLSGQQVKEILMKSAKRLPALEGKVACGGMVDAYAAVREALDRPGHGTSIGTLP